MLSQGHLTHRAISPALFESCTTCHSGLSSTALFGVLFEENKEPAFANYRLGEAIGFVIAFGYSSFLCVSTKLYILSGVLSLAMIGYGTVEYLEPKAASKVLAAEKEKQAEEEEMKTKM